MILLDSSFLIGFYNPKDVHHEAASVLMDRFVADEWGRGMLLEYVFLEVVSVIMLRLNIEAAVRVGRILMEAEELEFVPCSDLFLDTFDVFTHQAASGLSFVDSALVLAARNRAGGQILTFDGGLAKFPGMQAPQV